MWLYIKRRIGHALADAFIAAAGWWARTFGPASALVLVVMGAVLYGRYKLAEFWPHPEAINNIGQCVSILITLIMVGVGLLLFSSSIVATTRGVPLFVTAVEPFERRPGPTDAELAVNPLAWNEWLKEIRLGRWQSRDGTGLPGEIAWMRLKGVHILAAGETDMGKSGVEWQIYDEVEPAIDADVLEVIQFDPKVGAEMWPCVHMKTQSGKPYVTEENFFWGDDVGGPDPITGEWEGPMYEETFIPPLRREVAEMRTRLRDLHGSGREFIASPGKRHKLIMIDEGAQMVRPHVPKKVTDEIIGLIDTLCHQGRAAGYTVVVCTQYPIKEAIPFRDGLVYGICLPVKSDQAVKMVLGDGARQAGAEADKLPRNLPGIAYKTGSGARLLRVANSGPDTAALPPLPPRDREPKGKLDWGMDTSTDDEPGAVIYQWPHQDKEPAA